MVKFVLTSDLIALQMFINFEKQFSPAQSYFGLHVYWFWKKVPPCTSILSCMFNNIGMWIRRKNTLEIALELPWQCFGIYTLGMLWNASVRFRDPFQPFWEKKIPPARSYFDLHLYWFWEKNSPCTCALHIYSGLHI